MLDKFKKSLSSFKDLLPNRPVLRTELKNPHQFDLSKARDFRCVPIAFEIIKMVAALQSFPVGSHVDDKKTPPDQIFLPVAREFMTLLIKNDAKEEDIQYIFSLVYQGFEYLKKAVESTIGENKNRITELVYGLPPGDFDELTIYKLNEVVQRKDKIAEALSKIMAGPFVIPGAPEEKKEE